MKRALLVVHTKTFFPRMLETGKMLKKSGRYEPVFYLAYKQGWTNISDTVETLRSNGLRLSDLCRIPEHNALQNGVKSLQPHFLNLAADLSQHLPKGARDFLLGIYRAIRNNLPSNLSRLSQRITSVRSLIHEERIDVLLLSLDIAAYDTAAYVKAAHLEHIPVVVTFAVPGIPEEWIDLYSKYGYLSCRRPLNFLVGKAYPQWVCSHKGHSFLLLPASSVLSREWLKLAQPLPWVYGSTHADALCVESRADLEQGIRAGIPEKTLCLTGSTIHDSLTMVSRDAALRRADLYKELGIPPDRPMILSSLIPPYYGRERGNEFRDYKDLVEFWVRSLASLEGHNVVISLHPALQYEDMRYIEEWGARIARRPIQELIPLCRLYVASQCSTIPFAIACGKPVVNYDVDHYRFTIYEGSKGTITVDTKDEFLRVLRQLTGDPEIYSGLAKAQSLCASRWGVLDGMAEHRIIHVLDRLVKEYEAPA